MIFEHVIVKVTFSLLHGEDAKIETLCLNALLCKMFVAVYISSWWWGLDWIAGRYTWERKVSSLCLPTKGFPIFPWKEKLLDSSWNVMAHGEAREGKWRGNWRMEWVASTLHTASEHGVSSITTADAHNSAASSRLNWCRPADLNGLVRFAERRIWFLRVCHHISTGFYCPHHEGM